ncbi:MAG: TfoX/Sxy family protein [Proteobacteria bacterium]|nr:TfoX/Sxy family protein [Pseudomonadota bacterium]
MSPGKPEEEFVSYIVELTRSIGPVHARAMFGGHGLFLDGLMFALIADSELFLKADTSTIATFIDKGLDAFSYGKKGKEFRMSYYQCPEEALESSEEMNIWANMAYSAALRAAAKKRK